MSNRHRRTLEQVFRDPVSPTVVWADVEAMMEHYGAVIRTRGGSRVSVRLNGHVAGFHRPHPQKEAPRPTMVKLRTFLTLAGLGI